MNKKIKTINKISNNSKYHRKIKRIYKTKNIRQNFNLLNDNKTSYKMPN